MATLKDIAARAGINVTTASKALRDSSDVSRETALRVKRIAQELGYQPRGAALTARAENRQVLVVSPEATSNFYARMIQGIDQSLRRKGYCCLNVFSNFDTAYELEIIQQYAPLCAGIIYMPLPHEEEIDTLHKTLREAADRHDVPVVVIMNVRNAFEDFDVLVVDERLGYRQAVEYLTARGHTQFAFIGDCYYGSRLGDIQEVLDACKLTLSPRHMAISDGLRGYACGYERMGAVLRAKPWPTVILTQYDDIAVGAVRRIHDEGLRVPEDFCVVGFDESGYCKYQTPPLASIDQHVEDMGAIATRILMQKIQEPAYRVVQSVAVKSNLVVRRSMEGEAER